MADTLRLGIIGCGDNTHGKAWAELLCRPEGERFGMRPARLWDADPAAAAALAKTTGAEAVSKPEEAGAEVDGVLITEEFPTRYLELARPHLEAGRRVFLNRPFAGSMADARQIAALSRRHHAPIYSASALYHTAAGEAARKALPALGPISLFSVTGPTDHLFFYLPHAIAALVSVLGTGVEQVQAIHLPRRQEAPHLVSGPVTLWLQYAADSPIGPAMGTVQMVGPGVDWYAFRLKAFGAKGEGEEVRFEVSYDLLLENMAQFFRTGVEPIPHEVILEKTAIFHAALRSAEVGGAPSRLAVL